MEELYILLAPNKEHKKLFPNVPVIGLRKGENPVNQCNISCFDDRGRCEPCGKKTCLVTL